MAMTHFPDGAGGYAELAVVDAEQIARISPGTSFAEAAATPLAGGTAAAILARLCLQPGDRLLVLGASGGVGLFLLQLAAHRGIETIAVGRSAMHKQMLALGASSCIDYTREDPDERAIQRAGGPVDAIADLVGGTQLAVALSGLRPAARWRRLTLPNSTLVRFSTLTSASMAYSSKMTGSARESLRPCWLSTRCSRSSAISCPSPKRPKRTASSSSATRAER
jgi:NADPH:quinone reductase